MYRLSAFYLLLLHDLSAVLAQFQVQLNFYTDHQCNTPSAEHAGASIPISQCIVTPGLGSISHQSFPCQNGNVQLVGYSDTSCGNQLGVLDWYRVTNQCSARFSGAIAAISLTCNQETSAGTIDPGTLTTTSTIVVGQVADSAPTGAKSVVSSSSSVTHSNGSGASSALSVTLSSGVTTTQTASSSSPSSSNNGAGSGTGNSAGGKGTSSSSGLSTTDIISIAVGLGVGIPTIIIGLLGLRRYRRGLNPSRGMYPLDDMR